MIQVVTERRDAAAFPAPGERVEPPDGRALHLQVFGEQHDGPTVVLKAGAGAPSVASAWIQPLVAQRYTVVSYDRAGLGWSDPAGHGTTAAAVVEDLHSALRARGLSGPYILVGYSLGAHYVRAFAATHADEVNGVVLVDPSHQDQLRVLGEDGDPTHMRSMFTALRTARCSASLACTTRSPKGWRLSPSPRAVRSWPRCTQPAG
jgi:pimeloyl-ACP methyl ester carboxylesterase